ncbi:MAG TPA: DUF3501 family protein [Polyangiaceae bacterium]|nr:DUF3501 family protein [Polyangiaceae bacterium]
MERADILGLAAYEARRHVLRPELMRAKQLRQVLVGDTLNFMFESHETVRYQIQEVLRVEAVKDEARIEREIATYNRLLGGPGELGCTLLVELSGEQCAAQLEALAGLESCLYVRTSDGREVPARATSESTGQPLSLVQFLRFAVGGLGPIAVGCAHPLLCAEVALTPAKRRTLERDLDIGSSRGERYGRASSATKTAPDALPRSRFRGTARGPLP